MVSSVNPVQGSLSPADIDRKALLPHTYVMRNGQEIKYFDNENIDLVKMDFLFVAGTALQDMALQSAAAINLITEGTSRRSGREIAEFMDSRGIVVEKSNDEVSATLTVYSHVRYLDELLPLLYELLVDAAYPEDEFALYVAKQKVRLETNLLKTSFVARRTYYAALYGSAHPVGRYAELADFDKVDADSVRGFARRFLRPGSARIVLGGRVSEALLHAFDAVFGGEPSSPSQWPVLPAPAGTGRGFLPVAMTDAVQNTLRVGTLLPFRWCDRDYSRFMVLSTVLGGYFGSRLMANIREDKGYTYGVYAQTRLLRDSLAFFVVTDVAADKAEAAMKEIMNEIERLRNEAVPVAELALVRNCMLGDFVRSVDGVFERSERYCQMVISGIDESFTDNLFDALDGCVDEGDRLRDIACRALAPERMLCVSAGQV